MKKPNLPEGEWEIRTDGMWHEDGECYIGIDDGEGGGTIVIERLPYESPREKAIAKSARSILDMIDALIEIERIYESADTSGMLDANLDPCIQKARKALTKAGVTEDQS